MNARFSRTETFRKFSTPEAAGQTRAIAGSLHVMIQSASVRHYCTVSEHRAVAETVPWSSRISAINHYEENQ